MKIMIINGPNLNRLGKRQPEIYGTTTLADMESMLRQHVESHAAHHGGEPVELEFVQSNHEGELIDAVHRAVDGDYRVIINPGGFTHTSVALRDALAEVADGHGFVEVHISNVHAREPFRQHSFLSPIARGVIAGLGVYGYQAALGYFLHN